MFKWAGIFFVTAMVAAIFGFSGIAVGAASLAKVFFFNLILLAIIFSILGVTVHKRIRS